MLSEIPPTSLLAIAILKMLKSLNTNSYRRPEPKGQLWKNHYHH
ncbi:hypothetical protein [Nostoc sp.]